MDKAAAGSRQETILHICCVVHGSSVMATMFMYVIVLLSHPYSVCRMRYEDNAVDKGQKWLDHRSCVCAGMCVCEFWQLQHATCPAHHRLLADGGYLLPNKQLTKSALIHN
jgi:hypothetical protein